MIRDIVFGVLGCVFIVMGCVIDRFYFAKSLQAAVLSNRIAPTWLGRTLFLIFGLIMVIVSVRHLLSNGN
jgi:hypothetical protein